MLSNTNQFRFHYILYSESKELSSYIVEKIIITVGFSCFRNFWFTTSDFGLISFVVRF